MPKKGANISLSSYDDIFSTEESRADQTAEKVQEIPLSELHPFKDHPFKVLDDEKMQDLMESIRINGILSPVLVRPIGNDTYEMVSGHRRMHAAMMLGMDTVPAIIREMTDDEAVVKMVDANIQREELLPSEKAFAYKMKMDAMRRQGLRSDLTSDQNDQRLGQTSRKILAEQVGTSEAQITRYIRLTELIPELRDYVDQKRIQLTVGIEISYIDQEVQKWLFEYIKDNGVVKLNQITLLRTQLQTGAITQAKMIALLNGSQPGKSPSSKLTFTERKLREYFPATYTTAEMRNIIEDLLQDWKEHQKTDVPEDEEV